MQVIFLHKFLDRQTSNLSRFKNLKLTWKGEEKQAKFSANPQEGYIFS